MSDSLSHDLASLRLDRTSDSDPDRPRPRRTIVIVLAVVAVCAGVVYALLPRLRAQVFKTEVSITEVSLISPAQASITFSSTGYVMPQVISKVSPKIQGRVARLFIKEGDTVKAGEPLLEIEGADMRSAVRAAESRTLVAKARAQTARAQLAEIELQAKRERGLAEKGVAPRASLEDLEARSQSLRDAARAADAEVQAAQAEADTLRVNLDYLMVTAPIDGTILTKPPELGEVVGPMFGEMGGTVEIADFNSLLVETDVPESRLHMVKPGAPCEIVLDAYPDRRYRGQSAEIGRRVNRSKATVVVKVKFIDPCDLALPDMSARVSFLTEALAVEAMKEAPKIVIPAQAVVERDGRKVVFVVNGGKVRATPITLGAALASGFAVTQGPPPGTRIVNNPPPEMKDGSGIKEKND